MSIIRLKTIIPTLKDPDQTWALADPAIWIIIEMNLAVTCGCLSVIRPFLRRHFPVLMGESHSTGADKYNKATPSDYFLRQRSRPQHNPHSSVAKLSYPGDIASWDATGYTQEIKSNNSFGLGKGDVHVDEGLEMGALGRFCPLGVSSDISSKSPLPGIRNEAGRPREDGDGGPGDKLRVVEEGRKDKITKTVEVDVQR